MLKSCRVCRRPSPTAICATCAQLPEQQGGRARPSHRYDAEYVRNAAAIVHAARAAWSRGEAVVCVICTKPIPEPAPGMTLSRVLTVEHVRPRRDGGGSGLANLGPAHAACNYGWRRRVN